jgi:hypothetical protein
MPLYGTISTFTLFDCLKICATRSFDVPLPPVPNVTLPGCVRASCTISLTDRAGIDGCTAIVCACEATNAIGARSRSASYVSLPR